MHINDKILNENITSKVEDYLIEALSGIADLYHLTITTDDEKNIFSKQFEELSDFLTTWGLSEEKLIQIKNHPIHNPIEKQYEKIAMLEKVRVGNKSRVMLGNDIVDNVEESLIDALYELSNLYYGRTSREAKEEKLYTQQYGELFIFLSGWGVYNKVDWDYELPDDVMSEFNDEACKRHEAFELKEAMEIIQKKWQENKIYALSGFTFHNSEFFRFDIIALNIHQKFIFEKPLKMFPHYDSWIEVSTQKSLTLGDEKGKVVVGLGSLGSDGFIALVSNRNELIWSLYSEHTEAFIGIEYKDNKVVVESSKGYFYLISLDNPLELEQLENKVSLSNTENSKNPLVSEKEAIMKKIQQMWSFERVYNLSGLLFRDGRFFPFDMSSLVIHEKNVFNKQMRVSSLSVQWSSKVGFTLEVEKGKIVLSSSPLLQDGFIAFVSKNNELIWSIYSEYISAFVSIEHKDREIIVKSKHGYNYLISLDNPLEIRRLENKS